MKGWNFLQKKLSADGTTTLDSLRADKTRLEKRLAEIPALITRLQNSINVLTSDINWLNSLNDRRAKNWEQENGKSVKQAIYDGNNILVGYKADLESLNTELKRIPTQIAEIDKQISTLVQGESTGLSKGLDGKTAQELGQLELEREKSLLEHQQAVQQVELQQATKTASTTSSSNKLKWGITIGAALLLIAIIGYVLYQRKQGMLIPKAVEL